MRLNWLRFVILVSASAGLVAISRADDAILIAPSTPLPVDSIHQDQRILGVIPNYLTVSNPNEVVKPLTVRQKWGLAARSTADPFTMANVVLGAAMSQARKGIPDYGADPGAFGDRLGAAYGDVMGQTLLSGAVFASALRQDPRYFRMGPNEGILKRVAYSVSRVAITRTDAGTRAPNWSFWLGTVAAIGLSNAYYPSSSRNGSVMMSRTGSIVFSSALGNLLPEFWPDIQRRLGFLRRKPKV